MKRSIKWWVLALVLALLAVGIGRALSARKAQQAEMAAAATRTEAIVELAPSDLVRATTQELSRGLPLSGSLKAVQTALVKARVAGELQALSLREGDAVKAGQVVARVDATDLQARVRQAQQQADAAQAQIEIAQRQWNNNKALVDQGFISKTALDTSWNNLAAAEANHKAALAAVDVARKSLDDAVLRAPINGVVAQRLAQPGERVSVDARVLEIVDPRQLELEAILSAADSVAVRVGQVATLQVEGAAAPVTARVVRINPSAQAGSRGVPVYLSLPYAEGLRQGLFVQGTLDTGRLSALAVPLAAVRNDKPTPYVQLVRDGRVAHVPVVPGARGQIEAARGEIWVAVQGVPDGAQVIQGSVGPLREGSAVRVGSVATGSAAPAFGAAPATATAATPTASGAVRP